MRNAMEPRNVGAERTAFTSAAVVIVVAIVMVIAFACCGCASVTPVRDDMGRLVRVDGYKFLADVHAEREWEELHDGEVLKFREVYSTSTNIDKIFGGAADLFGTLFNGASKAMP